MKSIRNNISLMRSTGAFLLLAGLLAGFLSSCGSSNVTQILSAEERFQLGKEKFGKGDYLEAIGDFEIVKLQFPGSAVADSAQYFLAECHFNREEYLLAAEEYQVLKRNMPASTLVPSAQYKTGLSFYNLSPKPSLDQKYTMRAINELQAFIEYFPKNDLVPDAEAKIKELNARLAKKIYDSAVLYMNMEYYRSATIYFNSVVEKYHDTQYAEPALIGKVRSLILRRKYQEARQEIDKFIDKYPNSTLINQAKSLKDEIDDRIKGSPEPAGVGGSQNAERRFNG